MCKATIELNFNTAVTDVKTSFEKLILDRTESDPLMPISLPNLGRTPHVHSSQSVYIGKYLVFTLLPNMVIF
jgi:hypothetical protein